jgi:hypothetical protein
MAELFLTLRVFFSSSVNLMLCSLMQWPTNEEETPKDNLQTKHIRMGLTGTVECST